MTRRLLEHEVSCSACKAKEGSIAPTYSETNYMIRFMKPEKENIIEKMACKL